uniref:Uncharacterized protein n=1 Tax=Lutzomyia longipalpis TaxID=7200 RepID=A0A1B0CKM0_LUTLO
CLQRQLRSSSRSRQIQYKSPEDLFSQHSQFTISQLKQSNQPTQFKMMKFLIFAFLVAFAVAAAYASPEPAPRPAPLPVAYPQHGYGYGYAPYGGYGYY